jgi:hypothetical protein
MWAWAKGWVGGESGKGLLGFLTLVCVWVYFCYLVEGAYVGIAGG